MSAELERGFTLVELLAAVAIVTVLAGLSFSGISGSIERSRSADCAGKLRAIGLATMLYTQDNDGRFPRSEHSAAAHRELAWAASIAPFLNGKEANSQATWKAVFNQYFRCPDDPNDESSCRSYGLNVFLEVNPDGDDYFGSPASWRRLGQVPRPSQTILIAETLAGARGDHFMAHQWSGVGAARNAVGHDRHAGRSNYLFIDGHVESLEVERTMDPLNNVNLWNPALAK